MKIFNNQVQETDKKDDSIKENNQKSKIYYL